MDQQEINELLEVGRAYLKIGKQAIPLLMDTAAVLKPIAEQMVDFSADMAVRSVERMEARGLSREDAVTLTASNRAGMVSMLQSAKR